MGASIAVEVVYARPDRQVVIPLRVPVGATLAHAIRDSGIESIFPEIDLAKNAIGVFGELAQPSRVLRQGDRVEIYRPLLRDPRQARRKRAGTG